MMYQHGFNIIAPFWPLRYWDMEKVLEKLVNRNVNHQKFQRIEVTESASRYLLNPEDIHYLELKLKNGSYLFSKNGGHDLVRYQAIGERMNDLMNIHSFHSIDDVVVIEYNGNNLSMKLCSDETNSKICTPETSFLI